MYRLQRTVAFLLFALVLLSPGFVLAEGESTEPAVEQVALETTVTVFSS